MNNPKVSLVDRFKRYSDEDDSSEILFSQHIRKTFECIRIHLNFFHNYIRIRIEKGTNTDHCFQIIKKKFVVV